MAALFNRILPIFAVFLLHYSKGSSSTHKLNVPRIMLPYYAATAINFTIEASDGCYRWRSSRPEVASVQPMDIGVSGCSHRAQVTALSTHPSQVTSVVFAEEEGSGQIIRCDVIIDNIDLIDIITTTRVLYLGDSPEEFELRALDDEGNTFSSLEGLEFEWTLISDSDGATVVDAKTILKIVPFEEMPYISRQYISSLEDDGKQGDKILVEGIKAGSAKVSVRIVSPGFKDVKPSVIRLIVIDHLMLNPSMDIYILVHAQVKYKVEKMRQGKITIVPMPSSQYKIVVVNTSISTFDDDTSIVTGVALGTTEIKLTDRNIRDDIFSLPSAVIHVIEPKYLGFVIFPGKNWVLQTGKLYEIQIEIYDRDSHKMFPADIPDIGGIREYKQVDAKVTQNIRIETVFQTTYFEVIKSTVNGSHHYVRTKQSGITEIDAALVAVMRTDDVAEKLVIPIKETQEAEIYDPIIVRPEVLAFPHQPSKSVVYQYTLRASGGTGSYVWTSSNRNVATVNVHGTVSTANQIGMTNVTAADNRNPSHFGLSRVYVLPPADLGFLDSQVEALVGDVIHLPLAVYAYLMKSKNKIAYSDCREMPLRIEVADGMIFEQVGGSSESIEGACMMIHIKALNPGHTQLTVYFEEGPDRLQAAVTVAAYVVLKPGEIDLDDLSKISLGLQETVVLIDPEDIAVVTPASSTTFILSGGPQPWVLDPSRYFETITPEDSKLVEMKNVKGFGASRIVTTRRGHFQKYSKYKYNVTSDATTNEHYHVFRVLCLELGEQSMTVTVGNKPSNKNKFPSVATTTVRFFCTVPVRLQLVPVIRQPNLQMPCPISLDSDNQLPVLNDGQLDINVRAVDNSGHFFHNFSSVVIGWTNTDSRLVRFYSPNTMYNDLDGEVPGSKHFRAFQDCTLSKQTGSITLTATTRGYDSSLFKAHGMKLTDKIHPPVSATLDMSLVTEAAIEPKQMSIFNHPSNRVYLDLQGGSGHFWITPNIQGVADVIFDDKRKKIEVKPLNDGTVTITAHDLCLETSQHASAQIHIAGVNIIDLRVVDKVQIEHDIIATVQVLDASRQPLSVSYFPLMGLEPKLASDIISIRPDPDTSKHAEDIYTAYYKVHGATLGFTTLSFTAASKTGHMVSSKLRDIQVFPPMQMSPRNVTLLVGCEFQVRSIGGPQPQSQVDYDIRDGNIASITSSGLLMANGVGRTRVTGKAMGLDTEAGSSVVYSQDAADVHIMQLGGIKIHAPLLRLQTGTEMPVYAMGTNEYETPFTFCNCIPGLEFLWSVTNPNVFQVEPVFYEDGVASRAPHNVAMRIRTFNPGEATLRLQVIVGSDSLNQVKRNAVLIDEIQITVFERLELIKPDLCCHSQMLLTPSTQAYIKTTRDGTARMSYQVLSNDREKLLTVNSQGMIFTEARTGQASVVVAAHENFGINQTLVILVKVKPVSYIGIDSRTAIQTTADKLNVFPVGATISMAVNFYDNIGDKFQATNAVLLHRLNRFDLLQLQSGPDNGTFVARAAHVGSTVLKVWDETSPWIEDYVNIPVGSVVEPTEDYTVGDVICFTTSLLTQEGQRGLWSSSNSAVVKIDSITGVGVAVGPGKTTLNHDIANTLVTQADVTVHPIHRVSLDSADIQYLTTISQKEPYMVTATLNQSPSIKGSNCSAYLSASQTSLPAPPIQCHLRFNNHAIRVQAAELFHTYPAYDSKTGQYFCGITQLQSKHSPHYLSTLSADLSLSVTVPRRTGQAEVRSEVVTLTFVPHMYVQPTMLSLSLSQKSAEITVEGVETALKALVVTVDDSQSQLLEVGKPYTTSSSSIHYPIRLVDRTIMHIGPMVTNAKAEVYNTLTGEKSVLPVHVNLVPLMEQPPILEEPKMYGWARVIHVILNNYQYWLFLILLILAIAGTVLIGYHMFLAPRYFYTGTGGAFLQTSPMHGSPPPYGSPSPGYVQYDGSLYQHNDSSLRQRSKRSPTRLWSTAYSPQEGATPQY